MPDAVSKANFVALSITNQDLGKGVGFLPQPIKIGLFSYKFNIKIYNLRNTYDYE